MLPIQVTIRDIPNSQALESHINEKVEKITSFYNRINSCRVVVELAQKHKHQGKLFTVNIDLTVPGKELVVNRKHNEDVYIAVRNAFNAIARQLEKYFKRRRGDVKNHDTITRGYISRVFHEENYGFIQGLDGNEFYFSDMNVAYPQFEELEIGDLVQFIVLPAQEGLQANRVTLEKKVTF